VRQRREQEERCGVSKRTKDTARAPFLGLGRGPTIRFTSALTLRSFPMHDSRGNCPTASSGFRPVQKLRRRGRAPESMHDPSALPSTRVPLFWRRARPGNMTSHIKCDRSCRRAYALLFGRTLATSVSVAEARPGASYSWCSGLGAPRARRLAYSMMAKDKESPSGGQTEALPGGRLPLPSGEEPSASPLAGRK
jgi:hypothetical protein